MAADQFNSLGGYSVGIPPEIVIDANGNVVTNVLTTGNVSANTVYATYYKYANGDPFSLSAGGSNTQVQFNNNGSFDGIPNVTWNGNILSLGDISALTIGGGENGYFLQTDGAGTLTWSPASGNGGNGSPGGANTQVQFNKEGEFGGDAGFTYDDVTNTLDVDFITVDTVTGNLTGTASQATVANTVSQNAQPNITSVGTLTQLSVTGEIESNSLSVNTSISSDTINAQSSITTVDLESTGNANLANLVATDANLVTLDVTGNAEIQGILFAPQVSVANFVSASNLTVTTNANISGVLNTTGNVDLSDSANVNLGNISNISISGGINGYVLTTDGAGNLSWSAGGQGGNGVPGGSNTQIQFNDDGVFAGDTFFTFNSDTKNVTVSGNLVANSLTIGSGVYQFSRSNVYFATTTATANTALISIPAEDVSSVDFTVIATDAVGGNRQVSKLSAVMYDSTVHYNEYSTLFVNGLVGDFSVGFNPGNVTSPDSVVLYVEPDTNNTATYKIQITVYDD